MADTTYSNSFSQKQNFEDVKNRCIFSFLNVELPRKLYDYKLLREEKIINKKKIIFYRIQKIEDSKLHIFRTTKNYEIVFK